MSTCDTERTTEIESRHCLHSVSWSICHELCLVLVYLGVTYLSIADQHLFWAVLNAAVLNKRWIYRKGTVSAVQNLLLRWRGVLEVHDGNSFMTSVKKHLNHLKFLLHCRRRSKVSFNRVIHYDISPVALTQFPFVSFLYSREYRRLSHGDSFCFARLSTTTYCSEQRLQSTFQ